jgi:hypothetical protein
MGLKAARPKFTRARALAVSIACLLSAIASTAFAGDVHGTLTVPADLVSITAAPTGEAAGRARYWEEWNGIIDPRPTRVDPSREIAVVLTGEGALVENDQAPYRIHNGGLQPATMIVRVGTAFQVRNDDGCSYELFAEGLDEIAPLATAPGNARPLTISAAGHWPLAERNYPHVRGHLHAIPDLIARATVEANGNYTFRGVPAGSYVLHVYHGDHEVSSQPVTVTDAALTIPAIQVTAAAAAPAPAPAPAAAQ